MLQRVVGESYGCAALTRLLAHAFIVVMMEGVFRVMDWGGREGVGLIKGNYFASMMGSISQILDIRTLLTLFFEHHRLRYSSL